MNNETKRKGRPKGSNSFVAVSIEELAEISKGAMIPVSSKWLKGKGINPNEYRSISGYQLIAKKQIPFKLEKDSEFSGPVREKNKEEGDLAVIQFTLTK